MPSTQTVYLVRHAIAMERGEKWPMLTAYDAMTASVFDEAGIPVMLVGDSAGNCHLGYDTTVPVTLDEMTMLSAAVVRGTSRALIVGDLPFGSYQEGPVQALRSATRLVKEAGVGAVKLEGGVHMAASPDQFRIIYFQGHPEYDFNSLLKEYKREVYRFLSGELSSPPPFPEHYFSRRAADLATEWVDAALRARAAGKPAPEMPEREIEALLDNTWGDTAKAIVNNWLGLVYQFTNLDRKKQFMPGVDPNDPLRLRRAADKG